MRRMCWLVCLLAATPAAGQGPGPAAEVKIVKYADLAEVIEAHKGKVVLIDFWATSCVPCKQAFPHVLELQRAYAGKGLVVLTVATDALDEEREKTIGRVRKFLQEQGATGTINMILDEPTAVLTEALRIKSLPCMYVFGRDGKWKQLIAKDLEKDAANRYPTVEVWVRELVAKSAPK